MNASALKSGKNLTKPQTLFEQLPTLEIDGGKVIAQSNAIYTFIAEIAGLNGETAFERARVVMVVQSVFEILSKLIEATYFEKDEAKKAELCKVLFEDTIPKYFSRMEKILIATVIFLSVPRKMTLADITFFHLFDSLRHGKIGEGKELFYTNGARTPKLEELVFRVEKQPSIWAWLKKRPETYH